MELLCKGRMTHQELERLYEGHVRDNSIFCTDSHKSYVQFAKDFSLEHKRIKISTHVGCCKVKKNYILNRSLWNEKSYTNN